jgi:PII-like signaling protein
MKSGTRATLMRIYLQEAERHGPKALYEALVEAARDAGLAGATVLRGIRGFGPSARMLSSRILDLSSDLPIVVEIIDRSDRLDSFLEQIQPLLEEADSRALVTLEEARVVHYGAEPDAAKPDAGD